MTEYDALDYNTIQDIIKYQNDLAKLLDIVDQLAKDKYDLGYEDGFDSGELYGWSDCYGMMRADD